MNVEQLAKNAKLSCPQMAKASEKQKNEALIKLISLLKEEENAILEANQKDIDEAIKKDLSESLIDRLSLQNRIKGLIADIEKVIELPDPIGECFEKYRHHDLEIEKCRTPIGVIGVIYESRPNVTIDISALCLKSGNACILRGGSETLGTNIELSRLIGKALSQSGLPENAVQLISRVDRSEVLKMLRLHDFIDLIIPRGGDALHRYCRENSTIPVITGGIGICHLFVDETADLEKSLKVIINAKTQRPSVCNALDTLLVHETIASGFIPKVADTLKNMGVSFKLDAKSREYVKGTTQASLAEEKDWDTEWLSLILGIKVVKNCDEAIQHIVLHSTGHSDGILTENQKNAEDFVASIDSAAVYVNASTRFTDGSQLGLGSEVAISTQKLHARGPMGLKELTSYKWIIRGDYAIRK